MFSNFFTTLSWLGLRIQKVEIFDVSPSLPMHTYTKWFILKKRKIKYTTIFYLYLKVVRD